MPTFTVSEAAAKPYVSRRKKRHRRSHFKLEQLLSTRSVLGVLGFLVLVLLVSIGVIASQLGSDEPGTAVADTAYIN